MISEEGPPPLVERLADGSYLPGQHARGPYGGLQGGVAASILCADAEVWHDGLVTAVTTHFLAPIPIAPLHVTSNALRSGRRVTIVDSELRAGGTLLAVQRLTILAPLPIDAVPTPPVEDRDPSSLAPVVRPSPSGLPWLLDVAPPRFDDCGRAWFRTTPHALDNAGPVSAILPAADWAHGLRPPLGATSQPPMAIPNPDCTVHVHRRPEGDWIGIDPASAWTSDGVGVGWGEILDVRGPVGRVAMTVALAPIRP